MRNIWKNAIRPIILGLALAWTAASAAPAQAQGYYTWPSYSPTVAYDYVNEYGIINPPTQMLDDITNVAGSYANGWWSFKYGPNKNALVTSAAWIPMTERFNTDFGYITDTMRWPRDVRARSGYYSACYLFGSGLSTDNASNTELGGWQGTVWYQGKAWPMILASYYPVYSFDPACPYGDKVGQQGAMVHEGIHCILSSMPGCKNAGWFHEGGNTWLQGTMGAQRSGNYSGMGWLSAPAAIAPFMPIECYSGWLQDDSFGGPSAQGVNRYFTSGTLQVQYCTWRNLFGGTQYGECFPHAMEVILGPKSVAWVWRNATQSGRVLQDLAEAPGGIGAVQVRRLIQEYRGRQAMCDFGLWSYAYRGLLMNNWNANIHAEYNPIWINCAPWNATCYVATTQTATLLTPETRTLPGWSGANQIPLTVSAAATTATVTFNPIGANMSCQLVYRTNTGDVRYSQPVASGVCSIPLANVKNNVVIAVVCNTDYIYVGEATRTTKFPYTLTLGAGVTGKADIYTKWFDYTASNYTITASASANGTISPAGAILVAAGANRTFTITPSPGYVADVAIDGVSIGALASYTFNNVRGNHTIAATFVRPTFTIYASAAGTGTISPSGAVVVDAGASQAFTITPNAGYAVSEVKVDGAVVATTTSYTFTNIQANHTITAKFAGQSGSVPRESDLLFSCVTDSFPASGVTGDWDTYLPAGLTLAAINTPTVQAIDGRKWEQNLSADDDGYNFGNFASPIPCNGATIIVAVKPLRNGISDAWNSVVDAFYNNLVLILKNNTGELQVKRNGSNFNTGVFIPDGQKTILSLVVQPNGTFKIFANGTQVYSQTATSAYTQIAPGAQGYMHDITVGRNAPDGWSIFNGNIGDVYFYKVALTDPERQQLETALTTKFLATNYTITASAGAGGTITPSGAVSVASGANQAFTIAPNSGYQIASVTVDGVNQGAVGTYTFTNVTANHTIAAAFTALPVQYTITASAGTGGTINPVGAVAVNAGANRSFTITADLGYQIASVTVDGVNQGAVGSYTFTGVAANHTIAAAFTPVASQYTINAIAGTGGTINPVGAVVVASGANQTFTITPDPGYLVAGVTVDGVSAGAVATYTFTNVTANHTISAAFRRPTAGVQPPVFMQYK